MIHLVRNHQPLKKQVNKSVFLCFDDCVSDCISPSLTHRQTHRLTLPLSFSLAPLSSPRPPPSLCPPPPAVCLLPGTTVNNETVVLCLGQAGATSQLTLAQRSQEPRGASRCAQDSPRASDHGPSASDPWIPDGPSQDKGAVASLVFLEN